jgi:chorismate mutase
VDEERAAAEIAEYRRRIAEADATLVAAANRRIELVAELKRLKERHGISFVDPDQERRLVDALAASNPGPLSEEGLRELAATLLAVTKRDVARLD